MNHAAWIFSSIAVLSFATVYGCGNGGTTTTTAATGTGGSTGTHMASSTHATSTHAASSGATSGTGGGGTGGTGGSGTTPNCNPFTGAPCNLAKGEVCDESGGAYSCFAPPPPNDAKLCDPCGNTAMHFCAQGMHCSGAHECYAFCCADGDCGAGGKCDFTISADPNVGLCTTGMPGDAGTGDAGKVVNAPACSAPAMAPSHGSCFKP